jgi:hypothetical protein
MTNLPSKSKNKKNKMVDQGRFFYHFISFLRIRKHLARGVLVPSVFLFLLLIPKPLRAF